MSMQMLYFALTRFPPVTIGLMVQGSALSRALHLLFLKCEEAVRVDSEVHGEGPLIVIGIDTSGTGAPPLAAFAAVCQVLLQSARHERISPIPLLISIRKERFRTDGLLVPEEFLFDPLTNDFRGLLLHCRMLVRLWSSREEITSRTGSPFSGFLLDHLREMLVGSLRRNVGLDVDHHDAQTELQRSLRDLQAWIGGRADQVPGLWRREPRRPAPIMTLVEAAAKSEVLGVAFSDSLRRLRQAVSRMVDLIDQAPSDDDARWALTFELRAFHFLLPRRSGAFVANLPALRTTLLIVDDEAASAAKVLSEARCFEGEQETCTIGDLVVIYAGPRNHNGGFVDINRRVRELLEGAPSTDFEELRSGKLLYSREEPDWVLLDLSLLQEAGEELGGLDLLRSFRRELSDRPVLMYSAFEAFEHVIRAVQTGAAWYCRKSDPAGVLRSVDEISRASSWEKEFRRMGSPVVDPVGGAAGADTWWEDAEVRFLCWKQMTQGQVVKVCAKRLTSGLGGAVTLLLEGFAASGVGTESDACPDGAARMLSEARPTPIVLKIDRPYRMLSELERYKRLIAPVISNRVGRIEGELCRAGRARGAIAYTFSGSHRHLRRVSTEPMDTFLRDNLSRGGPLGVHDETFQLLDQLFDESLAPLHAWSPVGSRQRWASIFYEESSSLRESVEMRLPVDFEIELTGLMEPDVSGPSGYEVVGDEAIVKYGRILDVEADAITIGGRGGGCSIAAAGAIQEPRGMALLGKSCHFRIKARGPFAEALAKYRSLRPRKAVAVRGFILPRSDRETVLQALVGKEPVSDLLRVSFGCPLSRVEQREVRSRGRRRRNIIADVPWSDNPFHGSYVERLLSLLDLVPERIGTIHGDLNLGNILVETAREERGRPVLVSNQPWLIDFARTRRDSIGHDFAEFECDLMTRLLDRDLLHDQEVCATSQRGIRGKAAWVADLAVLRDFVRAASQPALDVVGRVVKKPALRILFDMVQVVRRKARQAGVAKVEHQALVYFYYLVLLKLNRHARKEEAEERARQWLIRVCVFGAQAALEAIADDLLRVSVAVLARIKDHEGKCLLGLNKNRRKRSIRVLTPIGGAVELRMPEAKAALDALGVAWDDDSEWTEDGGRIDLRFTISPFRLGEFEQWLGSYSGGPQNLLREMEEELVDARGEYKALKRPVFERELSERQVKYAGSRTEYEETDRVGSLARLTRRYSLVFDVECGEGTMAALRCHAGPRQRLEFVGPEEIRAGVSSSGRSIGSNAKALLLGSSGGAG